MKEKFFNSHKRINLLYLECQKWKGTPFKHWAGVCGRGCDCIHFVVRVLDAVGALQNYRYTIPKYNKDWHIHNADELLFNGLSAVPFINQVDDEIGNPQDGDLLLYFYGKASSHCSIYLKKNIYHSLNGSGVIRTSMRDRNFRKPSHMLRVYER